MVCALIFSLAREGDVWIETRVNIQATIENKHIIEHKVHTIQRR